jgi:hypothetical protein
LISYLLNGILLGDIHPNVVVPDQQSEMSCLVKNQFESDPLNVDRRIKESVYRQLSTIQSNCFSKNLLRRQKGRHDTQHNDVQLNDVQVNDVHHNDIQHNDIQDNDIQHNDIQDNEI